MAEGEEACKGEVKHLLLAKFKDGVPQEEINQLIKEFGNLVNLIQPMKSFSWGTDISTVKLNELGFTHIMESTFESTEGIAEYIAHPAHVEYANKLLPQLEKFVVLDYKPKTVHL